MDISRGRDRNSETMISIILPTYNEKGNIVPLIQEIFQGLTKEIEVIVVDDDSPDNTWQEVERLKETQGHLYLIRRIDRRGLVSALKEGIAASKGEVVVWLDSDLSMPPQKIKELLSGIDQGYDVVFGSRFVKGGGVEIITGSGDTLLAFLLSLILNRFIQFILGPYFKDYTSGFIALRRKILEEIPLRGDYGEYFIDLIYRAQKRGFKILEIPYLCRARSFGSSKTGRNFFHYFRRGRKYLWVTFKLKAASIFSLRNKL